MFKTGSLKLVEDNIDPKTVHFKGDQVNAFCNDSLKSEKSVHGSFSKFNTTKNLDIFPPSMTTSLTQTIVPSTTLDLTVDAPMPTSMFDLNKDDELSKLPFPNSGQKGNANEQIGTLEDKEAGDRYAALKDLDDIFKSTVMCEGMFNFFRNYLRRAGVNIFSKL